VRDLLIYFFRKNNFVYNFGLLAFASVYAYGLSFLFFESQMVNYFMIGAIVFGGIWLLLFFALFFRNKNILFLEREREKFNSFANQIKEEFGVSENSNIFEKIELIKNTIDSHFSTKGLFANRVFALTNTSLNLYIENLNIINQLKEAKKLVANNSKESDFYIEERDKNLEQNDIIVQKLDAFLKEIMSKKNNDSKINRIAKDFEYSMEIFNTIKSRR